MEAMRYARSFPAFELDEEYEPVLMVSDGAGPALGATVLIRGTVASQEDADRLRTQPGVVEVWGDTPIAPQAADGPVQ